MTTYDRSTNDEQRKIYWARRSPSDDLSRRDGFPGQIDHGSHLGNQSVHHPRVLERTAANLVGDLRRGDMGCLAVRSAQAARGQTGGFAIPARTRCSNRGYKSDKIDARKLADRLRFRPGQSLDEFREDCPERLDHRVLPLTSTIY